MLEGLNVLNTEMVAKWVQLDTEVGSHCSRLELSSEGESHSNILRWYMVRVSYRDNRTNC